MAEGFSPTGMYAHYGRKYRSAGIVHQVVVPVIQFDDNDRAMVPHPGGKGYLVRYNDTFIKRDGLVFMRLSTHAGSLPDQDEEGE